MTTEKPSLHKPIGVCVVCRPLGGGESKSITIYNVTPEQMRDAIKRIASNGKPAKHNRRNK